MTTLNTLMATLVGVLAVAHSASVAAFHSIRLVDGDGQPFKLDIAAADLRTNGLLAEGRRLLTGAQAVNAEANSTCQWRCGDCSGVDDSLHTQLANASCTELAGDLSVCGSTVVSGELRRAVQAGQCQQICTEARLLARCSHSLHTAARASDLSATGKPSWSMERAWHQCYVAC